MPKIIFDAMNAIKTQGHVAEKASCNGRPIKTATIMKAIMVKILPFVIVLLILYFLLFSGPGGSRILVQTSIDAVKPGASPLGGGLQLYLA